MKMSLFETIQREGGLEKEEETMGSCSSRDSDEMMMLKASVEKERHERSRHRSSSSRSNLHAFNAT